MPKFPLGSLPLTFSIKNSNKSEINEYLKSSAIMAVPLSLWNFSQFFITLYMTSIGLTSFTNKDNVACLCRSASIANPI